MQVWCRVSRISNDAAHHCKDDPSQFCHVITVRVGNLNGTFLKVDENVADRGINPTPPDQAVFFGNIPTIDLVSVKELVMYDFEMDEACTNDLHDRLVRKWIAPRPAGLAPPPPPPPPLYVPRNASHVMTDCCTDSCSYASDGFCDDGGPGSEYGFCGLGSDCTDCFSRCRSPVPGLPYIHSAWPSITVNTGGSYAGSAFNSRAAIFNGAWTLSFVYRGANLRFGSKALILDGVRGGWKNMDTSIGIGAQLYCGYTQTGSSCTGGNKELDRGSCTAQTLFGDDDYYQCRTGAAEGSNCPFVVVEGQGPRSGDMWCRVSRISNDAAHHCKDDPREFCHVVTVRAGPRLGTYLQVDELAADRNQTVVPTRQGGLFGGGVADPTFETSLMHELVMYDYELEDDCVEALHASLVAAHVAPAPIGLAPAPPPPPPLGSQGFCAAAQRSDCCLETCEHASDSVCDDGGPGSEYALCGFGSDCSDCGSRCYLTAVPSIPYVHSAVPDVHLNTGGSYSGTNFTSRAAICALHRVRTHLRRCCSAVV